MPVGSWVYDALDRLAVFGLIPSQTSGLRPWTRVECSRQVREAEARLETASHALSSEAASLVAALHREFEAGAAPSAVVLESVYSRNGVIAGPALNDSFHFGQTWSNDFGRPFGRGWNSYEGFTARAESGRFFAYVQGEYQRAPGESAESLPVRKSVSQLDAPRSSPAIRYPPPTASAFSIPMPACAWAIWNSPLASSLLVGAQYHAPLSFSDNAETHQEPEGLDGSPRPPARLLGLPG